MAALAASKQARGLATELETKAAVKCEVGSGTPQPKTFICAVFSKIPIR